MARVVGYEQDDGLKWNMKTMQNNVSIFPDHVPLIANVQALDKLWKKGGNYYEPNCQSPDATMSGQSICKMQNIQCAYNNDTKLPMVRIAPNPVTGGIAIIDGRHRFMFARDVCQQKNIYVAVDRYELQMVQQMLNDVKMENFAMNAFGKNVYQ